MASRANMQIDELSYKAEMDKRLRVMCIHSCIYDQNSVMASVEIAVKIVFIEAEKYDVGDILIFIVFRILAS